VAEAADHLIVGSFGLDATDDVLVYHRLQHGERIRVQLIEEQPVADSLSTLVLRDQEDPLRRGRLAILIPAASRIPSRYTTPGAREPVLPANRGRYRRSRSCLKTLGSPGSSQY
jgi:hypothetical protein